MKSFPSMNGDVLRKTTAVGMTPLLLAQVLIALVCVPETLNAGPEIRREMTWEQLPAFLEGEKKVTVVLTAEGAVRSDRVTVLSDSIHLGRVTKATNWKRHPWGSETSIARDSVREIRLENTRGHARVGGGILGAAGGLALWFGIYAKIGGLGEGGSTSATLSVPTIIGAPLGGAVLGHWLGQRTDRETTIITIVD